MVINTKMREYHVEEEEDELKRSLNLILFSIPESGNGDGNERKEDDKRIVSEILQTIGSENITIESLTRLGPKPEERTSRSRPIRIKLHSKEEKDSILAKAKNLRSTKFERIHIDLDLTPSQKAERKILVQELKTRKQQGETNLIIRGNRIIEESTIENETGSI